MKIPTTKWFWIPVVILILVGLVFAGGKFMTAKYKKQMDTLKEDSQKLKKEATDKEKDFLQRINDNNKRSIAIQQKLESLQRDYISLNKQYEALQEVKNRLEVENEDIRDKIANLKVPASRVDRAAMFRGLGY